MIAAKEQDLGPDHKSQITNHRSTEEVVPRIRKRAIWIGAVLSIGAFLLGWRRGVTLTICAAVVIFSFLVFEKLTVRLGASRERWRIRALLPLLLITAAAVGLLLVVFHWKAFDPIAAAVGLSAVVLAILAEVFERSPGG